MKIQLLIAMIWPTCATAFAEFPRFEEITIDRRAGEVVYAVTLADVNGDKRQDIVALTENAAYWYENPSWKKSVLIKDQTQRDNVCIAPHDIDQDGHIDFAIGAGWLNGKNTGTIQWISRGSTLSEPWNVHLIGTIPWTHRMRWSTVLPGARQQLVVSPLKKTDSAGAKLTAFTIPANPRTDRWQSTTLDASLNNVHNHWHVSARSLHRQSETELTFAASDQGVFEFTFDRRNEEFTKSIFPESQPAGEVKVGQLKSGQGWFLTTIEPMHGTSLVVYRQTGNPAKTQRVVIEDQFKRGHALWCADVDGDGDDEIIAGHSDRSSGETPGPGLFVYDAVMKNELTWEKHTIDNGGIATEDVVAGDLNGDGLPDIVAGGRATHNVKLYLTHVKK